MRAKHSVYLSTFHLVSGHGAESQTLMLLSETDCGSKGFFSSVNLRAGYLVTLILLPERKFVLNRKQ